MASAGAADPISPGHGLTIRLPRRIDRVCGTTSSCQRTTGGGRREHGKDERTLSASKATDGGQTVGGVVGWRR